jgi:hypothetical protein
MLWSCWVRIIEPRVGSSEAGGIGAFLRMPGASAQQNAAIADLISDLAAALNVFEFEEVAHRKMSQAHWAYMASGVDDDATLRANRKSSSGCS